MNYLWHQQFSNATNICLEFIYTSCNCYLAKTPCAAAASKIKYPIFQSLTIILQSISIESYAMIIFSQPNLHYLFNGYFITQLVGLGIHQLHPVQSWSDSPPKEVGSDSIAQRSVEYPFIAITSWSTLTRKGSTC